MAERPHIVIFNPDQWRGDVMGHMGDPAAVTSSRAYERLLTFYLDTADVVPHETDRRW